MKMPQKPIAATLVILVAVVCSCAGKVDYSNLSAEQMYSQADALAAEKKGFFSRNSREIPLEMLKELQLRHPFSPYAIAAAIKTADIYFDQGKYKTAADQYKQFIADNPGHEERERAVYRLSESFYRIRESHKRDQSPCKQAIYWFQTFLSDYPDSSLKEQARSKIDTCTGLVAKSELEIGKFYMKRKHYEAARRRFLYIADKFPDTEEARESEALMASLPTEEETD